MRAKFIAKTAAQGKKEQTRRRKVQRLHNALMMIHWSGEPVDGHEPRGNATHC